MNRSLEFDGLRGIAISLVLWHHLFGAYLPSGSTSWLGWQSTGDIWDWGPLAVLWSLAVEEQFYLVAPWVVRVITPARVGWLALLLVVLAPLIRAMLAFGWPEAVFARHVLMPARMDTLALGVLIAWSLRTPATAGFYRWLRLRWRPVLLAASSCIVLLVVLRFREGDATRIWYGYSLIALCAAAVVAIVAAVRPLRLVQLLSLQPLVMLGRHSYAVYLWHMLIGVGVIRYAAGSAFVLRVPGDALWPMLGFADTWSVAAVSWHYFEEPLIRWGHRHAY